jgi:hypothetical protein
MKTGLRIHTHDGADLDAGADLNVLRIHTHDGADLDSLRIHTHDGADLDALRIHTLDGADLDALRIHTLDGADLDALRIHTLDGADLDALRIHTLDGADLDALRIHTNDGPCKVASPTGRTTIAMTKWPTSPRKKPSWWLERLSRVRASLKRRGGGLIVAVVFCSRQRQTISSDFPRKRGKLSFYY